MNLSIILIVLLFIVLIIYIMHNNQKLEQSKIKSNLKLKKKFTDSEILNEIKKYNRQKLKTGKSKILLYLKKAKYLNLAINQILQIIKNNNKQIFKDMLPEEMKSSFNPSKLGIYPMVYIGDFPGPDQYVPDEFFSKNGIKKGWIYVIYNKFGNPLETYGTEIPIEFHINGITIVEPKLMYSKLSCLNL